MVDLAREVVANGLTVREVERRAREGVPKAAASSEQPYRQAAPARPAEAQRIEDQLRRYLQTDVRLSLSGNSRGEIRIQFYNNDDLTRVLELMLGTEVDAL
jgi:ParB family chromosome partitioning protein